MAKITIPKNQNMAKKLTKDNRNDGTKRQNEIG